MEQLTDGLIHLGIPGLHESWIKRASLRQLLGSDEQFLKDSISKGMPLHSLSIALLRRLIKFEDIADARLNQMSIGDRVILMLQIRRIAFGDIMPCVISCASCSKKMSVDLSVTNLLQSLPAAEDQVKQEQQDSQHRQTYYNLEAEGYNIQIRPLCGLDQEYVIKKKSESQENLQELLLRGCIVSSKPALPASLPPTLMSAIERKLSEIDPLSEILLEVQCPECGNMFLAMLSTEEFVLHEIEMRSKQLEHEVHFIAFNYHWSEDDILALPITKRRRYVELINAALSGENS